MSLAAGAAGVRTLKRQPLLAQSVRPFFLNGFSMSLGDCASRLATATTNMLVSLKSSGEASIYLKCVVASPPYDLSRRLSRREKADLRLRANQLPSTWFEGCPRRPILSRCCVMTTVAVYASDAALIAVKVPAKLLWMLYFQQMDFFLWLGSRENESPE
jgi:hypothetical protein